MGSLHRMWKKQVELGARFCRFYYLYSHQEFRLVTMKGCLEEHTDPLILRWCHLEGVLYI